MNEEGIFSVEFDPPVIFAGRRQAIAASISEEMIRANQLEDGNKVTAKVQAVAGQGMAVVSVRKL